MAEGDVHITKDYDANRVMVEMDLGTNLYIRPFSSRPMNINALIRFSRLHGYSIIYDGPLTTRATPGPNAPPAT